MITLDSGQFVATSERGTVWDMAVMDAKCREVRRFDAHVLLAEYREKLAEFARQRGQNILYVTDLVPLLFAPGTPRAHYEGGLPHEGGLLRDYTEEGDWQAYPDDVLAELWDPGPPGASPLPGRPA